MAYCIEKKKINKAKLPYLPEEISLSKVEEKGILDFYKDSDYEHVYSMLKEAVEDGMTYPQEKMDRDDFENYYLSHDVFVFRNATSGKVMGSFYIKPNFPGRSSHICNAGFLVHSDERKKGIGEILFQKYLQIAKDLDYKGSFFNLVYASNHASVRLCRKLGYKEIGIVPKAGNLKGIGYVDAFQFYYDLTTYNKV